MSMPSPPGLPRRDRIAILLGLAGTAAIAWLWLARMAAGMDAMAGMDGDGAGGMASGAAMAIRPWTAGDWAMMFAMWAVMMVGMMLPTAAPTTLVYAAIARKAASQGTPIAPTAAFVAGYVAMWTLFSVGATAAQWALDQAALLSPMMVASSPAVGAITLAAAGLYQLTPAKDACLEHCRSPAHFLAAHWRAGTTGAFRVGLAHGAYCLGCCWALMGLLFVGGVMNLLWIAAITLFVLAEKVMPHGRLAGRASGVLMLAAGAFLALRWLGIG